MAIQTLVKRMGGDSYRFLIPKLERWNCRGRSSDHGNGNNGSFFDLDSHCEHLHWMHDPDESLLTLCEGIKYRAEMVGFGVYRSLLRTGALSDG